MIRIEYNDFASPTVDCCFAFTFSSLNAARCFSYLLECDANEVIILLFWCVCFLLLVLEQLHDNICFKTFYSDHLICFVVVFVLFLSLPHCCSHSHCFYSCFSF